MNQRKKQHDSWDRQLTIYLEKITWCEKCKARPKDFRYLDKAHRLKRRFIGWRTEEDRLEYFMAAKLCRNCHKAFDEATGEDVHQIMFEAITAIVISRRNFLITGVRLSPPFGDWDPARIYSYSR